MGKEYQPHQLRAIDEMKELNEKIVALSKFIYSDGKSPFSGLPEQEKGCLIHQLKVMQEYSMILSARIAMF